MKLAFLFLDGVGLAPRTQTNPFAQTSQPTIKKILGRELLLEEATVQTPRCVLIPISASMGVEGAGQSGTGQFSLYTSLNGAKIFGKHFGPFLPTPLRPLLAEMNLLKALKARGKNICYANAYPHAFIERCKALRALGKIRSSVLFEIALQEQIEVRSLEHLMRQEAISGDIINAWWKENNAQASQLVVVSPEDSARNFVRLLQQYDAVFYEFFLTDLVGHRRLMIEPSQLLHLLDAFLGEILQRVDSETLLVLTSDHGNFEDMTTDQHTHNPVPLLAFGKGAHFFYGLRSLDEVAKTILKAFDCLDS
ncbi:MAG: hypothetical protein RMI34_12250 [Chloroherpetonaceae bacterium]|nr:hypothetical protein [Chloroherpetonaceae bacterium]MCS7212300.1 hypothetical protein [Chloroherpetonaceae bacterium]MDW8020829.1 hypothetical protein [Chloroherpetonaceae bacterium]MDW8466786.1 hypothetical protein [Chloroherpetonaceae bacterium]